MNIFIDTADLAEIREACSWGVVDGLTTNPSLIRKAVDARQEEDLEIPKYIEDICRLVHGPVSLEVISLDADAMVSEAIALYERFNPPNQNVVIKIPVNTNNETDGAPDFEGLKAIRRLAELAIPVNATLIMTPEQALLSAKAGARYVSPFMGRVDDFERSSAGTQADGPTVLAGVKLLEEIAQIFQAYSFECSIIAASVRHIQHIRAAELAGVQIATIPFAILREMVRHPKTVEGVKRFSDDVVPQYASLFSSVQSQ